VLRAKGRIAAATYVENIDRTPQIFYSTTGPKDVASKLPVPLRDPGLTHDSMDPVECISKRHLNRFIRYSTAHGCDQQTQTDTYTDTPTTLHL